MTSFFMQDPETILLHGGQIPDPTTGARAVPIYQTTSYVFKDTKHAQNLFGLAEPGNIYSRIGNPTVDAFEQRVAQLEDGVAAVATSSGMAAITFAILNVASAGDEIITDSNLYGGTYNLFANTLPRYGINVKFVDGTNPKEVEAAITDKTKAIFGETITNPSLHVFDIETIATIAHAHHIPLIIDNTFAPYLTKPFAWGADIIVHSATKWIGGHGTTIGGIIVDGGRFDWNNERFPDFTEPDESYNGLRFIDVGPAAFATKLRVQLIRDIGACLSPHSAFLLLQGLETLHLRMQQHTQNAQKIASYLEDHPAIEWVSYPGLPSHPSYPLIKKYFRDGTAGSIITFGIKGGREAGRQLIDHIELWSHVANVGDAKSLIIHPASTTHQQLTSEELAASGTTEETVRLSIGLESVNDLLITLDQAIAKATGEQETIVFDDQHAIHWLLHSSFIRDEGNIRKKTIAVYGLEQASKADEEKVLQLRALGFDIVAVGNPISTAELPQYDELSEVPIVDAIWLVHATLPADLLEQLVNKKCKLLWIEQPNAFHNIADYKKAAEITVITHKNPYDEALRLRNNSCLTPV
ncbi:hypothetical protein J32TS6_23080 [Virgibacillus pantothenticus]|uniref:O-acetylhomoserine sulfhydrylase n=1 Tax=Virgibacillus pantothenticus TaxID=1473 RepID=A0A0L0QS91_VIRPA|nr:O-acetylhomoserine aminocarboxypropyltransferase/cysteine synthase family protein [Virgibacillus pantothenticus]KNE21466.1 O-acetylhomoserine sulfhydrylase [Virgibacillus pantothenticus]MBU8567384.1 O-acetylhomoserine aminocarboxypropyltransferase/cysteine synthase [Virgibacillus pantothenticus]MBU8598965.1 O-acetylhomoserine aminocarboxypropyltransferase/cysteine synthase [Virgibacillus pantothenticus]MBU8633769.1 O-acetylhomoserine aminocarboxypropyltransferase/cysteine synthase [Virgibaci